MLTKISCTDHSTIILLSQIFIINGINRTKMLSKEFLIRINGKRVHYTDPTRFEDLWKLNYRSQSQKNIKNSYFKALFYNLHFQRKNKGAWIVSTIFWPICHKQIFLVQTIIITFIYQNFKKILWWTQSYEDAPFLGPKWYICPNFFWKIINIILIYLFAPFIAQNFKKILPADSQL